MVGENTVFTHNRNDVRCDTHGYDVEQRNQMMEFDTVTNGERLHKLETDSTTGKVGVRVRVVQAFGVQYSYGRRENIIRHVMVADDKVNPFFFGIRDFLYCFYSAIEYNNQSHTGFSGVVHSFFRNTIPFVVSVGYVVIKVRIELLNKLVDQCHGSSTVYVIISIN